MISSSELRELALFKEVSANAVARLATAMREQICKAGDVILKEGDRDGGLFLVASGRVAVRKKIDDTRSKVIAHMTKGGFFGEMSLLDEQPASAEVVAEEPTRLFRLTRTDFKFLMSKAPTEALDHVTTLLSSVCLRLRQTTRELVAVYQVARDVGNVKSESELVASVVHTLASTLGGATTVGLYRWNNFNNEYARAAALGPSAEILPAVIEAASAGPAAATVAIADTTKGHPLTGASLPAGALELSRCDLGAEPQALFVYFRPAPQTFDAGDRQAMETMSSVLAPAFETFRAREEDDLRRKYEERKQRYSA
jgi:CRP-like cAMP-binding protein